MRPSATNPLGGLAVSVGDRDRSLGDDLGQQLTTALAQAACKRPARATPGLGRRGPGAVLRHWADLAVRARAADPLAELHERLGHPPRVAADVDLAPEAALQNASDIDIERQYRLLERKAADRGGDVGPTPGSDVRSSGQPTAATIRALRCRSRARRG